MIANPIPGPSMPAAATPPKPPTGSITKAQGAIGSGIGMNFVANQLGRPCGAGTYDTYRKMLTDPTIALAHAASVAPIIGAGWSVEADDDAPFGAVELVQDVFEPMQARIVSEACRAIYYGWQSFEKVWKIDEMGRTVLDRLKSLIPDTTMIQVDKNTGAMLGVKNDGVPLTPEKCVVLTYDREGDNYYGRSRMENIREFAWHPWSVSAKKLEQYQGKCAGVLPVVHYPVGQSEDATGTLVENLRIAAEMIRELQSARGVTLPTQLAAWAEDLAARGVDVSKLMAWQIEFLEAKSGHGAEFLSTMDYQDKLKVRGYLLPERAILEGQFGTKAEAGVHGDIAVTIAQQWLDEMVRQLNCQVVDDMLRYNYGQAACGTVYLVPGPITDEAKGLIRDIVSALYSSNADLAHTDLDIDAMLDSLKLPKAQEVVGGPLLPPGGGLGPMPSPTPPGTMPPGSPSAPPADPASPVEYARSMFRRIRGKWR